MRKLKRILHGLLALTASGFCVGGIQAADSTGSATPASTEKITLKGSFIWSKKAGKSYDLKAELTPNGSLQWKVVYNFLNPLGEKPTTYTGTITGDLQNGAVKGTGVDASGKRTFEFQGAASNGVLTFSHSETTPNRKGPTGTGNLKLSSAQPGT